MVDDSVQHELRESDLWRELETITDPEIPVLSLVDMKVIRSVSLNSGVATVIISPTFVGCPALELIKEMIRERLLGVGCTGVEVQTTFSPPWSTDMLDTVAREKLRSFGIAPPVMQSGIPATLLVLPSCPFCNSRDTQLENEFGATLCKQLYYCNGCRQSFERFKTI
jgi:ring-1,2-phenylacetyl-CoA epoxidase subunit PaaD